MRGEDGDLRDCMRIMFSFYGENILVLVCVVPFFSFIVSRWFYVFCFGLCEAVKLG
jgi:hypothetical protein